MTASARLKFLKKQPNATMEKLNEQRKAASGGSFGDKYADFWYPELDKNRNGYAIIRFLPYVDAETGELQTYTRLVNHLVPQDPTAPQKGTRHIYEVCPNANGGAKCPICEHTDRLWALKTTESEAVARKMGKRFTHFANVLVIKDPKSPENEGKVKKFRFGKAILNMINDAANPKPKYEGAPVPAAVDAFSPFDGGANFELIISLKSESGKASQISYDKSSFMICSPIADTDEGIDLILSSCQDLTKYEERESVKSYEAIKERFESHLGTNIEAGFGGHYAPANPSSAAAPKPEPAQPARDFSPEAEQAEQALAAFADTGEIEDDDIPF